MGERVHNIIKVDDTLYGKDRNLGLRGFSFPTIIKNVKTILKDFGAKRIIFFDEAGDLTYANNEGVLDVANRGEEQEFLNSFFIKA